MALNIIEKLANKKTACRSGELRTKFSGVTIHETGNKAKGAGALSHAAYLLGIGASRAASWHYCVDDTNITRSIPEAEAAWHSGKHKGNYETIAIEICVNPDGDFRKACLKAAELAADILKRNGITAANYKSYLYQHNHWSGKNCPETIRSGKTITWEEFTARVGAFMGDAAGAYKQGDAVILTGYLYKDSYASAKGKYQTSKKATITKIVDTNRPAPYLLNNGLGWARRQDLSKQ